jgi:hypothetical protein
MARTEIWLYSVGDGVSPGSYHYINGTALCNEGSDKIGENEDAVMAAEDLKACYTSEDEDDDEPEIAIVIKKFNDEDDLIEEVINRIV